ncbi:flavoprotein [Streptomyces sp. NPDC097595]|uniref:flavoprotein n=1 Tax=Streptomyces sp. NPDC097595 TaxID=3366090 RepID=UPI0038005F9A
MADGDIPGASGGVVFTPRRLLLVGTGSIGAAFLPYWMNWLAMALPEVECRVVVTRSAERFVTRAALSAVNSTPALLDVWPDEPRTGALHVEWTEWAEAVAVYPATVDFISRMAAGRGDSPAMLALQCTEVPVGIAPSLPPGAVRNPLLAQHLKKLRERPNICVATPEPGSSSTTGRQDAYVPPALPNLLALMERAGVRAER